MKTGMTGDLQEKTIKELLKYDNIIPVVYDRIDSTNAEIKRRIHSNAGQDETLSESKQLLVVANEQTMGRGRLGRSFESPVGTGIYMSLLIRPVDGASNAVLITSAAAVAVSAGIQKATGIETKIKWVNDIYKNDKKICGILAESMMDSQGNFNVVLGIGINVTLPEGGFGEELNNIAGALYDNKDEVCVSREKLIAAVINEFVDIYDNIEKFNAAESPNNIKEHNYIKEYRMRSMVIGKNVRFNLDGDWHEGKAIDIDECGGLVVDTKDGVTVLRTGEITLRLK